MLTLFLRNNRDRQDILVIFLSAAIITVLYLLLLRYADKFPSGVPAIFSFIYGIFITIDAHILLNSVNKRSSAAEERRADLHLYYDDIKRYDLLLDEVQKEIERLEEMASQSTGSERSSISQQIDYFKKRMFHLQEEKFSEIEKLIRSDEIRSMTS